MNLPYPCSFPGNKQPWAGFAMHPQKVHWKPWKYPNTFRRPALPGFSSVFRIAIMLVSEIHYIAATLIKAPQRPWKKSPGPSRRVQSLAGILQGCHTRTLAPIRTWRPMRAAALKATQEGHCFHWVHHSRVHRWWVQWRCWSSLSRSCRLILRLSADASCWNKHHWHR